MTLYEYKIHFNESYERNYSPSVSNDKLSDKQQNPIPIPTSETQTEFCGQVGFSLRTQVLPGILYFAGQSISIVPMVEPWPSTTKTEIEYVYSVILIIPELPFWKVAKITLLRQFDSTHEWFSNRYDVKVRIV